MTRFIRTTNSLEAGAQHGGAPLALITGASGGIGEVCAMALATAGYGTIITGRNPERLQRIADKLNSQYAASRPAVGIQADLSDPDQVYALTEYVSRIGTPDVFVSAAGITSRSTDEFEDTELRNVLNINSIMPMMLTRNIYSLMKSASKGYILNIASRAGLIAFPDKGIYGASKAAIIRYFDALYSKTLSTDVRVTSICPAWVNTDMAMQGGCEKPANEILQADDIASIIVWLVRSPPRLRIRELVVEAGGSFSFR